MSGALQVRENKVLPRAVDEIRASLRARMSAVSIVHQDWQYLIAAAAVPAGVYSRRTSFCTHDVATSSQYSMLQMRSAIVALRATRPLRTAGSGSMQLHRFKLMRCLLALFACWTPAHDPGCLARSSINFPCWLKISANACAA